MLLYDNRQSSNALKVRFLLAELGIEYRREEIALARPRAAHYLQLNPLGGVPAIDDDGFVLAESNTILRYLADREGRDDLYPRDLHGRARVDELLDRWSTGLRSALFRVEAPALGYTAGVGWVSSSADHDAARREEREIAPQMTLLDGLLAESGYALGPFTIADCSIAPALYRTTHTQMDLTPYPRIARLRDALLARPAFRAAEPLL
jgi:glutathione S-transferase